MDIKLPFIKVPIGAGDLVKAATTALGVKPCGGCQQRAEAVNRLLNFTPTSQTVTITPPTHWTTPPNVPEGWTLENDCDFAMLLRHTQSGKWIVWNTTNGRYSRSHTFCCSEDQAQAELRRRCQP